MVRTLLLNAFVMLLCGMSLFVLIQVVDQSTPASHAQTQNLFSTEPVMDSSGQTMSLAAKPSSVEIFVTNWCPACKKAENWLRANDIPFTAHNVQKSRQAAQRMAALGGDGRIPFAIINGSKVVGFTPALYRKALNR
ncbi:MAG: glutaredoxin family protein [Desulfohalobiaceae bacterium]